MIGSLSLRIAGSPVHLTTARSFAGAVGRVLGLNEGQRHDLRLAVSELLTEAIGAGSPQLSVVVEIDADTPTLHLATDSALPSISSEISGLLGAMFDHSVWSPEDPWIIRLVPDSS